MFIYSFPIFFQYIHLGRYQEYVLTILFIVLLLFIITPKNSYFHETQWGYITDLTFFQYLFDAWNGQVKLWLVFWPFFIFLNLTLYMVDSLARASEFTVSSWDTAHFMLVTPILLWIMSVWRNSMNTCCRYWAIGARFITLSVIFEYGLKWVIRQDYPRIFFNCQDKLLDYIACF